jgi:hypothetical protein
MTDDIPLPSSKLLLGTPKTTIAIAANCGRCHSDRPAWWTDEDGVDYETTSWDEPFKGREVSRKSAASLIVKIIRSGPNDERPCEPEPGVPARSRLRR